MPLSVSSINQSKDDTAGKVFAPAGLAQSNFKLLLALWLHHDQLILRVELFFLYRVLLNYYPIFADSDSTILSVIIDSQPGGAWNDAEYSR